LEFMKGNSNNTRVRSSVQTLVGGGNLMIPVPDRNCQISRNPKTPKIGGNIFGEFFFQNSPNAPCVPPPTLRFVLTAMLLISCVCAISFDRNFSMLNYGQLSRWVQITLDGSGGFCLHVLAGIIDS